ncbi:MAG: peptidyl-prolyl cis-trans isomerase [Rhodocyclaceae bacterium]|nr:peptidyl-prolyl cis-trans isomerase [Rhodocyclaceae bacterium]
MNKLLRWLATASLVMAANAALAADDAVLAESPQATVTQADLEAELGNVPAAQLEQLKQQPNVAEKLVGDIHLRRRLAARAEAAGMADESKTLATLKLLRERVLASAYLRRLESEAISPDVVARLAESEYRAQPERFQRDEEVHVRHILVKTNACDEDRGRGKLEALRQRALGGESFADLAKEFSEDPGSAAKGGDLGFVPRGKTVKPFEDAAFALKDVGELSEVVESQFGFHLIRLEARRSAGIVPFAEAKDGLQRELAARLRAAARMKALEAMNAEDSPVLDTHRIMQDIEGLAASEPGEE